MEFENAHAAWINGHLERRTGERRARLARGHQYLEKTFVKNIWWPLRGNFENLHPEYEVLDWRGRPYFADHAYTPNSVRMIIELEGYEEHVANMDRGSHCREANRELFLEAMGFRVITFTRDDVVHRPELCINLLRMILSRYEPRKEPTAPAVLAEMEVLRYAVFLARPIKPIDVASHCGINHRTAVGMIQRLVGKGWLEPFVTGSGAKVLCYKLTPAAFDAIARW